MNSEQLELTPNPALDLNEMLIAEFNYVTQTAFQANENRARVVAFYLSSVASLGLAICSIQLQSTEYNFYWAFVALFGILIIWGFLTLLQLVRLRLAWYDSVQAMNQIKKYYVERVPIDDEDILKAIRWRDAPARFRIWSISALIAFQVSMMGGVMAGAAVMFWGFEKGFWWWEPAIITGLSFWAIQLLLYWSLLRNREDRNK